VQVEVLCIVPGACPPEPFNGWDCIDVLGASFTFSGLPDDYFTMHEQQMNSGNIVLYASSAVKKRGQLRNEIVVDPGALISFEPLPEGGRWPGIYGTTAGNQNGPGVPSAAPSPFPSSSPSSSPTTEPFSFQQQSSPGSKNGNKNGKQKRELRGGSVNRELVSGTYNQRSKHEGTSTVLVVYVTSLDSNYTGHTNFTTAVDEVLGTYGDTINMVRAIDINTENPCCF
jgi:hypothetical protein